MSAKIVPFPTRYDIRRPPRRRRRTKCPVVDLRPGWKAQADCRTAFDLCQQASILDETDPRAAIPLYERALQLDPGLSIAITNLGNCHYRLGSPSLAEDYYKRALAFDPHQPEALYNLGYLHIEAGRAERAVSLLRAATEADPRFADAHFNLAAALEQTGAPHAAQAHWREYIKLEPAGVWSEIARRHLTVKAVGTNLSG